MSERKERFTPGPWITLHATNVVSPCNGYIARAYDSPLGPIANRYNATLIAAAPEMYENEKSNVDMLARCENLLRGISESYLTDGFQDHAFYREWADEIREYIKKTNSLLAKARGEVKE